MPGRDYVLNGRIILKYVPYSNATLYYLLWNVFVRRRTVGVNSTVTAQRTGVRIQFPAL